MARLKCGSGRSGGSSPHSKTARAGKTIAFLGIIRLFHGQPPSHSRLGWRAGGDHKTTLDLGQEDLEKLLGRVVHAATLVLGHMALDLDLKHRRMMPELFPSATGFGDPLVIEEEAVMDLLAPSDPFGEHLGAEEGGETGNWVHHGRLYRGISGRRIA